MELATQWIGDIEYEEMDIISFPDGLPGFSDDREFVIVPADQEEVFFYLQSVSDPEVCLLLTNPFPFFSDYQVEITEEDVTRLGHPPDPGELTTFTVVSVAEVFAESTTNLMAPIFINKEKKIGLQFIPQKSDYNTRHPLFVRPAETGGK
jgi:flagellar assembly factor FliW